MAGGADDFIETRSRLPSWLRSPASMARRSSRSSGSRLS